MIQNQSDYHANVATENAIRLKQADTRTVQLNLDVHVHVLKKMHN